VSASARFQAIATANNRKPRSIQRPVGADGRVQTVAQLYGERTFDLRTMADKLPKSVFRQVEASIRDGVSLTTAQADVVAHAVKEWALENGCTHFTHWFQPMTGSTAEKHDAFLTFDKQGNAIERFTGAMLIQSEPDASSFPSGGMRTTFEARGYTAWDPSSPMFIMESANGFTLCIPSAFVSYTGEALDAKTPLLRSMQTIERATTRLLEAVGRPPVGRVKATLGCEQEYFLIDRAYWALRPDLALAGRTVLGAKPPKGQSLDDHYFGSIQPRVAAFMEEVELELYRLGVPAKTRHNEVAPSQFELAPIFDEANVGVDHNQLVMEILRRVAMRHDFKVLLHEKPFAGINGSGKHNNWSLSVDGENLLEPGDHPQDDLRFLAVLASTLLGVWRHGGLLRASVATHGNDFRLGANEAPPAIMSVFLGEMLTRVCDSLSKGDQPDPETGEAPIELGVAHMPRVARDNTDRNRTSPLAFTGNKFEFRAVGSTQNPAWPVTVLNTIVADGMEQILAWAEEEGSVLKAVQRALTESRPVRFEGDGYSDEWVAQAEAMGLKNLRKTPHALDELATPEVISLFERHGVLTPDELKSRYNVATEQYLTAVDIERDTLQVLVNEMVVPAALAEMDAMSGAHVMAKRRYDRLSAALTALAEGIDALDIAQDTAGHDHVAVAETVAPCLLAVRAACDSMEGLVADHRWPLPKYREMLFLV
jgi:glutamine synthetase